MEKDRKHWFLNGSEFPKPFYEIFGGMGKWKFFKKRKKNDWRFMWKCNTIIVFFYMDNKKVPIDQLIFIAIFAFIIVVDLITQIKKWLQARK